MPGIASGGEEKQKRGKEGSPGFDFSPFYLLLFPFAPYPVDAPRLAAYTEDDSSLRRGGKPMPPRQEESANRFACDHCGARLSRPGRLCPGLQPPPAGVADEPDLPRSRCGECGAPLRGKRRCPSCGAGVLSGRYAARTRMEQQARRLRPRTEGLQHGRFGRGAHDAHRRRLVLRRMAAGIIFFYRPSSS